MTASRLQTPTKAAAQESDSKTPKVDLQQKIVPLIEKRSRSFGIGQDVIPKRDLTRFVKWPEYIRVQRQRRILYQRLKVPPAINQFTKTLDKNTGMFIVRLVHRFK